MLVVDSCTDIEGTHVAVARIHGQDAGLLAWVELRGFLLTAGRTILGRFAVFARLLVRGGLLPVPKDGSKWVLVRHRDGILRGRPRFKDG